MGSDSESDPNLEWQGELDKLVSDNSQNNWSKISAKRAHLAAQVTQACNKTQTTYDNALKTRKFDPEEAQKRLSQVQQASQKLNYICKICVDAFNTEMKTSMHDEFILSSNYYGKYGDSANVAISQMTTLLNSNRRNREESRGAVTKTDVPPAQSKPLAEASAEKNIVEKKLEGGKDGPPGAPKTESASMASAAHGSFLDWVPQEAATATSNNIVSSSFFCGKFDITEVIPKKFSGAHGEFPEFSLRLQIADAAMSKMGYNNAQRLMKLLDCLEGHPYSYVKDLPLNSEESYKLAINTLTSLYSGRQSVFRDAVIRALNLPKCTVKSRSNLHSEMVSFSNIVASQKQWLI